MMRTIIVLFTRDLRVHDHSALASACGDADRVALFVFDRTIMGSAFAFGGPSLAPTKRTAIMTVTRTPCGVLMATNAPRRVVSSG